jgi:hypothetical protein
MVSSKHDHHCTVFNRRVGGSTVGPTFVALAPGFTRLPYWFTPTRSPGIAHGETAGCAETYSFMRTILNE